MRGLLRGRFLGSKVGRAALTVAVVAAAVGLWAFQPWRLFTSSTVDEALPGPAAVQSGSTSTTPGTPPPSAPMSGPPSGPTELAAGDFVTQEHRTSGRAKVISLADGSRVLRLENLSGSDGPDLHVWLSDATAGGDWGKYDDGRSVKLGELKATAGNQNYAIPADATLEGLRSVVIWCDRFNVAFGSAPLDL